MKTTVIYARCASEHQAEQSINKQLQACKDYAQRNNLVIVDTYIDRGMAGTNDNRPDFQRMIKDAEQRKFKNIIVYSFTRFTRNQLDGIRYKQMLENFDVKILSILETVGDEECNQFYETFLELFAEKYREQLSKNIRKGIAESKKHKNGGIEE